MRAAAITLPAAIVRTLLVLTAVLGASALRAQDSAGSTNIFDQLKKASTDVSTLFKPASKSGSKSAGAGGAAGADDLPAGSVELAGFLFVLNGCEDTQGSGVACHFHATNQQTDRALRVAGGANSYIIDADGEQYQAQSIRLGSSDGATMTTAYVPVEGVIVFGELKPGVRKIAELHLQTSGGPINWRNVSLRSPPSGGDTDTGGGASETPHARTVAAVSNDGGASSHGPRLTNDDVIRLLKAGLAEPTIVQFIDGSTPAFDTSANGLIALKQAGASDTEIQHIFTRQQQAPAHPQAN